MYQVDESLQLALRTHQEGKTRAIASYQGVQTAVQLEQDGHIRFDGDAKVQSAGAVTAIGVGDSLVPKAKTDPLAPAGQELAVFRDVRVRDTVGTIPLGVYRITRAGDRFERLRAGKVYDWSVSLTLKDRFEQIDADDFLSVDSPTAGGTVWSEVRRLSPVPVQQTLSDAPVPAATLYPSRIEAVTTLLSIIGQTPMLTRAGVLTGRPTDAWLSTASGDGVFDINGTIHWADEMTNDFFNQVQVISSRDSSIVAYARLDDDSNPLSVRRAGGRTKRLTVSTVNTVLEAQAVADTALLRLLNRRSRRVSVTCTPEALLLELGDVGWVRELDSSGTQKQAVFGEVAAMSFPINPTIAPTLDLIVAEEA